jgi:hypothetical protein
MTPIGYIMKIDYQRHAIILKCPECRSVIQSAHRHDFVRCSCNNIFVDGGDDYPRYSLGRSNAAIIVKDFGTQPLEKDINQ